MSDTDTATTTHTPEEVRDAVNAAADMLNDELDLGGMGSDLVNLMVNATLTLLESPGASFSDVVEENYQIAVSELREWWTGWA